MTELIKFLTSKEIIMVYIVAAIACALYFVINMIDKLYRQKRIQRQNTRELNQLVEDINYELAKEREKQDIKEEIVEEVTDEMIYIEPVMETITEEQPIIITEEVIKPEVIEETIIEVNDEVESIEEAENIVEVTEVIEEQQEVEKTVVEVEDTLDYTSAEPDQTEAQAELRRLTEALEQAEEATKNIDLTSYEEMQEKEAIISLDELMKRSKEMYESNELTQYADEGNEPISIEDLERKIQESLEPEIKEEVAIKIEEPVIENLEVQETFTPVQETLKLDDFYTVNSKEVKESKTAYQGYKSMPVISPIYGLQKTKSSSDLELENTANYEKLDEEIKKTNEFIMTLKELQSNLD